MFLTVNCTSVFQPLDCGPLQAFKCYYKNNFLRIMLDGINAPKGIFDIVKEFTVKRALWFAASARGNVSQDI